jgi:hypothetical protein
MSNTTITAVLLRALSFPMTGQTTADISLRDGEGTHIALSAKHCTSIILHFREDGLLSLERKGLQTILIFNGTFGELSDRVGDWAATIL